MANPERIASPRYPQRTSRSSHRGFVRLAEQVRIALADWLDLRGDELLHLLRCSANELPRSRTASKSTFASSGSAQAIEQIVFIGTGLQRRRDRLTVSANTLVDSLPVAAARHGRHEDVLGRHVRKNLGHASVDHIGIDDETIAEIQGQSQHGVGDTPTAEALFKRLEVDRDKQQATLDKIEMELKAGDARRGREAFFSQKNNCTTCHAVRGQGGQVGPDLSQIGALRTKRDLLEAVVFPSANFARGYEPYLVTIRAGKVYPAGILRRQTADAIYLVTGDRSEVRIHRAEIDSMLPGKVSIMPQGLDGLMSRQELSDLLAFLSSLR